MSLMSWKILSSAAGLLTLGALLEVRSQTLNGVPDVTAEQITSLEQCLGVDAVGRVQRSLDRWQQPCDDVWESPVWSRRRLEVQGSGREWEEVLWQLVFREDLTSGGGAVSPVPCVPTEGSATSIQATVSASGATATPTSSSGANPRPVTPFTLPTSTASPSTTTSSSTIRQTTVTSSSTTSSATTSTSSPETTSLPLTTFTLSTSTASESPSTTSSTTEPTTVTSTVTTSSSETSTSSTQTMSSISPFTPPVPTISSSASASLTPSTFTISTSTTFESSISSTVVPITSTTEQTTMTSVNSQSTSDSSSTTLMGTGQISSTENPQLTSQGQSSGPDGGAGGNSGSGTGGNSGSGTGGNSGSGTGGNNGSGTGGNDGSGAGGNSGSGTGGNSGSGTGGNSGSGTGGNNGSGTGGNDGSGTGGNNGSGTGSNNGSGGGGNSGSGTGGNNGSGTGGNNGSGTGSNSGSGTGGNSGSGTGGNNGSGTGGNSGSGTGGNSGSGTGGNSGSGTGGGTGGSYGGVNPETTTTSFIDESVTSRATEIVTISGMDSSQTTESSPAIFPPLSTPSINHDGTGGGTGGSYGGTLPNGNFPSNMNPYGWFNGWNNQWAYGGHPRRRQWNSGRNPRVGWPPVIYSRQPRNPWFGPRQFTNVDDVFHFIELASELLLHNEEVITEEEFFNWLDYRISNSISFNEEPWTGDNIEVASGDDMGRSINHGNMESLMLLDDEVLAKQAIEQSTPQEVFVTGCKLRGARFLTETDEIDMVTLNRTLNSFAIADSLKQLLLQNRRTCLDYSSSIVVEELTFPLRNELGRQLAFFQCVLQQLLTSCDTFQQLEEALGGTDLGDLLNSGSIEDVINEILSG
ncbi:hypothetical protein FHG87_009474 [Trinorchestia longiramus]|nr:hypothetical protein FHG87_009474 [Trinorchestia longiramus]